MKIQMIIFDIDGVITDGKLVIDSKGGEYKSMDFRDIDAIFAFKRNGYQIAFVTGENTKITEYFNRTFKPDYFYSGNKDKANAIKEISEQSGIPLKEICYIGDGKYDVAPMEIAGYSACPKNAIEAVKNVAGIHLNSFGGNGCIHELMNIVFDINNSKKEYEKEFCVQEESTLDLRSIDAVVTEYKDKMNFFMSSNDIKHKITMIADKMLKCMKQKGNIIFLGDNEIISNYLSESIKNRLLYKKINVYCEVLKTHLSACQVGKEDWSGEEDISFQVAVKANEGDILFGIMIKQAQDSMINALDEGKKHGTFNIVFVGEELSCKLKEDCDLLLPIPIQEPFQTQGMVVIIWHIILELLDMKL